MSYTLRMSWEALPLSTPLGRVNGRQLAISGTDLTGRPTVLIVRLGKPRRGRIPISFMETATRNAHPPKTCVVRAQETATLAQFSLGYAQVRAEHAGTVPRIRSLTVPVSHAWPYLAPIGPLVLLLPMIVLQEGWHQAVIVALIVVVLTFGAAAAFRRFATPVQPRVVENGREVLASEIKHRISGEIPSGPTPQERVDVVKEAYGSLLGDIAYRIECSALFDPAVPSTQRFQLALLAWDPSAPHASDLAAEVEVAFAEARSHAEKVGWSHLPETCRETARRAQKAVRVALESREPGERKTAAAKAAKLLTSLSQYYLPVVDPEMPSLIGERKQIGPVR